jgi:peptidoglycan/LPS O-acetylase OafA/YrhL
VNLPKLATVTGAAVTTFLLLGAATIEVMTATVGGDIGAGIVGVFVGAVAGLLAGWVVAWRWGHLDRRARSVLLGYGSFGLTVLFLAFLSYVNTPGVDAYLGFQTNLVIAAVVALVAATGRWWQTRSTPPAR